MIIINYWHDRDDETVTSVVCNTEEEARDICKVLHKYKMDPLSREDVPNPTTAAELEEMFKNAYGK